MKQFDLKTTFLVFEMILEEKRTQMAPNYLKYQQSSVPVVIFGNY